ncbi:MAG: hypothetical protein LC109_10895 [Bacteroidia bacterium]|nr:hypothetical protein [Bacteroidia bacterium]
MNEHHLYGSSRLGVKTHKRVLLRKEFSISGFEEDGTYITDVVTDSLVYVASSEYFCRVLAQKQYEMTNHLGNVLATVLDRRTGVFDPIEDTLMYYTADVVNATLYYPFGQAMLSYKNEEYKFAYGLNGQEKEDDIFEGAYSAEYWQYDSRLGRRWNKDQVERPYFTVYGVLGNNPIINVDVAGDDWFVYSKTKKFLGYTYGTGYTLVWVPSNSVIFDKSKENYAYLAKSLSIHSIRKFLSIKYKSYVIADHILLPILAYHKVLESTFDKRLLNGYAIFGTMQESSSISGIHSGDKNQDYTTDMSKIFVANENITVQNFYSVVMYSFLTGKGPENFYFGPDHEVSKSLENSKLVTTALNLYNNGSSDDKDANDLRAGKWINIPVSELEVFGIIERSDEHGTILTPEHLVGSAQVQITESEDGKELIIRIWNTTSLGSGTVGAPRVQRPNSDADQPYTNVSQSFEIRIPKSSQ